MTLDKLHVGQSGIIRSVGGEGALRLRLLDMGVIPKTHITVTSIAPMGDPVEVGTQLDRVHRPAPQWGMLALVGLLLCSGNDAAAALADHCGGTASFVRRMNGLARELGMEDTSFANPSGLDDDGHYSTARDMARLAVYAAGNHTFARLCSTRSVTVGGRTMTNHNRLLRTVPGCIGMKTGYTRAAGRTLVSAAERDGRRLVAVTLQDGNDWADHAALYDWGFAQETRQETAALNREDTP